jgi:hypothetical protein
LIDALPRLPDQAEKHPLRHISSLSETSIRRVAEGFAEGVKRVLRVGMAELRSAFKAYDIKHKTEGKCHPDSGWKFELPPKVNSIDVYFQFTRSDIICVTIQVFSCVVCTVDISRLPSRERVYVQLL